jgi:hypothetical protein
MTAGQCHCIQHGSNQPHLTKDESLTELSDLRNSRRLEEATQTQPDSSAPIMKGRNSGTLKQIITKGRDPEHQLLYLLLSTQ